MKAIHWLLLLVERESIYIRSWRWHRSNHTNTKQGPFSCSLPLNLIQGIFLDIFDFVQLFQEVSMSLSCFPFIISIISERELFNWYWVENTSMLNGWIRYWLFMYKWINSWCDPSRMFYLNLDHHKWFISLDHHKWFISDGSVWNQDN